MNACRLAATNHFLVVMVAVVMSLTVAIPLQGTSDAGIAANINQVQKKLKFSINAYSLITRPSCVSTHNIHLMYMCSPPMNHALYTSRMLFSS